MYYWIVALSSGYLTFVLLSWSYEAASLRSIKRNDRSYSEDDNDYNPRYKYVSNQALTDSKYHGLIDCESTVTNLCPQSSLSFEWSQCVLFNVPLEVFAQCNAYLDSFPTFHVTIACADEISEFCSDLDPSLIPDCLIRVA